MLDVRLPIGILFLAIGVVVAAQGFIAGPSASAAGLPIDLIWGAAMALFGVLALALAASARSQR